jgi:hypothetical protein
VRLERLGKLKNAMTSSGIESAHAKTNIEMNIISAYIFDFISKCGKIVLFEESVMLCFNVVKFGKRPAFRRNISAGNKRAEAGGNLS